LFIIKNFINYKQEEVIMLNNYKKFLSITLVLVLSISLIACAGSPGSAGDAGLPGLPGLQGVQGDAGLPGLPGLQGVAGSDGSAGSSTSMSATTAVAGTDTHIMIAGFGASSSVAITAIAAKGGMDKFLVGGSVNESGAAKMTVGIAADWPAGVYTLVADGENGSQAVAALEVTAAAE
jgi:hypothetical protein